MGNPSLRVCEMSGTVVDTTKKLLFMRMAWHVVIGFMLQTVLWLYPVMIADCELREKWVFYEGYD